MDPKASASLERILTIYATYLIMKYGPKVPGFDASIVPDLIVVGGSALSVAYAWYTNRKAAILTTAASLPEVKKIELVNGPESTGLAKATPSNVTVTGESK